MRWALAFAAVLLSSATALAQPCKLRGPRPLLISDTVTWTLVLKPNTTCLHGVRSASLILDRVMMAEKPQSGDATIQGYGLTYKPNPDFKGEDRLSLVFIGATAKSRGTSTVDVLIRVE